MFGRLARWQKGRIGGVVWYLDCELAEGYAVHESRVLPRPRLLLRVDRQGIEVRRGATQYTACARSTCDRGTPYLAGLTSIWRLSGGYNFEQVLDWLDEAVRVDPALMRYYRPVVKLIRGAMCFDDVCIVAA